MEFEISVMKKIKEIMLNHMGIKNPITSRNIAKIVGIDPGASMVKIRQYILATMEYFGIPIAAKGGNKGYFLMETEEELQGYLKRLESRLTGTYSRMTLVQQCFAEYYVV